MERQAPRNRGAAVPDLIGRNKTINSLDGAIIQAV
jgi:hypothetical protein